MDKRDKKNYRCPKMGDKRGYTPPPSAYEKTYSGRLSKQMEETISAVTLNEIYPPEDEKKEAVKNEKRKA